MMFKIRDDKLGGGCHIEFTPPAYALQIRVSGFENKREAKAWLHSFEGKVWAGTVAFPHVEAVSIRRTSNAN